MYEKYTVLLFWKFQIKWIYVVILENIFNVQYFYTQMTIKLQESYLTICWGVFYMFIYFCLSPDEERTIIKKKGKMRGRITFIPPQ